jgi:uncharacterized protein YjiS (DUF1127 family)
MTKAANRRLFFWSGLHLGKASLAVFAGWVRHAQAVRRSRRELGGMDERMLSDIGISRAGAHTEANRKFWDLPPVEK